MKDLEIYQVVVPIIAIIFLAYTVIMFRRGRSSAFEMVGWMLIWGLAILLALLPDAVTNFIAKVFGIKSNINAIVFLGLGILFFLQFHLYMLVRRQNQVITDLVRKLALRDNDYKSGDA
jgi:hypothetical protein